MTQVTRLAGAMLVETDGSYYLVGNTKEPCKFAEHGFEPPAEIDALKRRYIRLGVCGPVELIGTRLTLNLEGDEALDKIANLFLITRNGSVSERLWRLVTRPNGEEDDSAVPEAQKADWLGEMPEAIWHIVRESVLRC